MRMLRVKQEIMDDDEKGYIYIYLFNLIAYIYFHLHRLTLYDQWPHDYYNTYAFSVDCK